MNEKKTMLSSGTYDKLKFIALLLLPALGTLYFTIAQTWGLPKAEEVVGTVVAVDTFLGVLLKISNSQYDAVQTAANVPSGYIHATGVDELTGHPNLKLTITKDPAEILEGDVVKLKVGPPPTAQP